MPAEKKKDRKGDRWKIKENVRKGKAHKAEKHVFEDWLLNKMILSLRSKKRKEVGKQNKKQG